MGTYHFAHLSLILSLYTTIAILYSIKFLREFIILFVPRMLILSLLSGMNPNVEQFLEAEVTSLKWKDKFIMVAVLEDSVNI